MGTAPKRSERPVLAHWRTTRADLQRLVELYAADAETPAVLLPVACVHELIELFDSLLEFATDEEERA